MNRGAAQMQVFEKPSDYQAIETLVESPMRICLTR